MPAVELVRQELLRTQNPDGGWGHRAGGSSWTEPTALAVLALHGCPLASPHAQRGVAWLRRLSRPDGGVAPCPAVSESSWVTALAVLVESVTGGIQPDSPPVRWLLDRTGEESKLITRLRIFLLGNSWEVDNSLPGWPWLPGSAAWVVPTSWAVIALTYMNSVTSRPEFLRRAELGRRFLLSRQCRDGGWNYGASRSLGVDASSYPETTGIALAALQGERSTAVELGLTRASGLARNCRSTYASALLTLGMAAHGRVPEMPERPLSSYFSAVDLALDLLARRSIEHGGLSIAKVSQC